jgi:hypothetical protein
MLLKKEFSMGGAIHQVAIIASRRWLVISIDERLYLNGLNP